MPCKLCGNHSNKNVCLRCKDCDYAHQMKFGINWRKKEEKKNTNEPCPHFARFQLPNREWLTYKCVLKNGHDGECNFNVDPKQVERIARDSIR